MAGTPATARRGGYFAQNSALLTRSRSFFPADVVDAVLPAAAAAEGAAEGEDGVA